MAAHSPVLPARSHDHPGGRVSPVGRPPCGTAAMLCIGDPAHHYGTVGELLVWKGEFHPGTPLSALEGKGNVNAATASLQLFLYGSSDY